jgi:hypothetical protein
MKGNSPSVYGLITPDDKAVQSFTRLRTIHPTAQCHRPEDWNPQQHQCGNLRSHKTTLIYITFQTNLTLISQALKSYNWPNIHISKGEDFCEVILGKNLGVTQAVVAPSDM